MKYIYARIEHSFEKVTHFALIILGNSITFIVALVVVIIWLSSRQFFTQGFYDSLRDVIQGVTFLSLFIIQKAFNRFSASLHIKINELIISHASASNAMIGIELKTEHEMSELNKEYSELVEHLKEDEIEAQKNSAAELESDK